MPATFHKPAVSVVIPAKNEAGTIGQCLESIRAASGCRRVEIIVVDNGSADDTREIAQALGALVLAKPGVTISELRNCGARLASAPVVAFVDADIVVSESWLDSALAALGQPGVVCAGCSPDIPAQSTWMQRAWHYDIVSSPSSSKRQWLGSANLLVARDVFEKAGGFDTALTTCEDVDLGYRLGRYGTIVADKSIKAVHLGETRTLAEFFRKESWRGIGNFDGLLRHGLVTSEIPSHLVAFFYLSLYPMLPVLLLLGSSRLLLALFALSLLPPLAKVCRLDGILQSPLTFCQVYLVWLVYCWARGYAGWRWLRRLWQAAW
ncbi:MAG TPA: glycosyltransferase [Geomonas sp.]|nr:glycosyltransferase [Geomonas sp.]